MTCRGKINQIRLNTCGVSTAGVTVAAVERKTCGVTGAGIVTEPLPQSKS